MSYVGCLKKLRLLVDALNLGNGWPDTDEFRLCIAHACFLSLCSDFPAFGRHWPHVLFLFESRAFNSCEWRGRTDPLCAHFRLLVGFIRQWGRGVLRMWESSVVIQVALLLSPLDRLCCNELHHFRLVVSHVFLLFYEHSNFGNREGAQTLCAPRSTYSSPSYAPIVAAFTGWGKVAS